MPKQKEYVLSGRGETWRVNEDGYIYAMGEFSADWQIIGIAQRWNGRPTPWAFVKAEADKGKTVKGYLHDLDHGTHRMWGGSYLGKVPTVTLRRR